MQGDPFASPSNVSVLVPGRTARFPEECYRDPDRRTALQDHLLRLFGKELSGPGEKPDGKYGIKNIQSAGNRFQGRKDDGASGTGSIRNGRLPGAGSGKSGLITTSAPGQEILERTACRIDPSVGDITLRFEVGLPANGRTIHVRPLLQILFDFLPEAVRRSLTYDGVNKNDLSKVLDLADDQSALRKALPALNLCAFVADGSILPRQSGVSALPMKNAVPFRSPDSMAVEINLPHRGRIRGMGIRRGVTLIVGGGYHGKSTLLQALERGVYDHIRGDGREYTVTDRSAVKVRSEDGRSICGTDISLFIHDLPNKKDTVRFYTENASGSTSQAANVIEAIEAGTSLLLMDEDTSATNFMVRDELMAGVVEKEKEPITPFLSRIRGLYEKAGVSVILAAGSSGAFFHIADTVIQMDEYVPVEITAKARKAAEESLKRYGGKAIPYEGIYDASDFELPAFARTVQKNRALQEENRIKIKVLSKDSFLLDHEQLELRGLEQIADREQTAALAYVLKYMQLHILDGKRTIRQAVAEMQRILQEHGLEILYDGSTVGNGLAYVRPEEIFGTLNRYRKLRA